MKWKKILFVCLTLFFVFGYSLQNVSTVFGATYDKNTSTIDGQPITGTINNGTVTYFNTANGVYSYPNSAGSGALIKESTSWTDIQNANRNYLQVAGDNLNPAQIYETTKNAVVKEVTAGFVGDIIKSVMYVFAWVAQNILLKFIALMTGIAGLLFDAVINLTIVNMGTNIDINNPNSFINIGWTILRDIINIMFIFVLLYIGIMTIVKGFDSGTSKMISTVIVIALIINFSLFFTKIVIDASNIIAINFYTSLEDPASDNSAGIAAIFIKELSLSTQYGPQSTIAPGNEVDYYTKIIVGAIGGSIVLAILGIIILIACFMFISRYIILIFVLISSAAAIGSWILPRLKSSIYDKWFSALIGQSFFAPVFMLFIYLTALFVTTINISIANMSWSDLFMSGNPSSQINLVLNYVVVIGALIGSIIISQSLSNMAGSGAGKITAMVGGGAIGLAGVAGRNTLGRASRRLAELDVVNNFAARSAVGRGLRNTLKAGAKSSFDLRASSGASKIIGATGVDLGKAGGKGGYAEKLEKQIKAREGFYKDIGEATQGEKLKKDALQSRIDNLKETQDRQKLIKEIKEEEEELKLLKEGTKEHTDAKTALDAKKVEAGRLKTEINKKTEEWRKSIKEIDGAGKERSSAYVESFDKLIGNVPKIWVGQKNKLAAVNLRNAKRKEQTDSEKTIGALKDLQKAIKESKKE